MTPENIARIDAAIESVRRARVDLAIAEKNADHYREVERNAVTTVAQAEGALRVLIDELVKAQS